MSVQALAWAFAQDLPSTDKFVLVSLANHASHEDAHCWPSQKLLQKETGLGRATIIRALQRLEDAGMIFRQHRQRENGSRASDEYWLNIHGVTERPRIDGQGLTVIPPRSQSETTIRTVTEPSVTDSSNEESAQPDDFEDEMTQAKVVCFNGGLDWLQAHTGKSVQQCRSMLGGWAKASDDNWPLVLDCLRQARVEQPADLYPWMVNAIQARASPMNGNEMLKSEVEDLIAKFEQRQANGASHE